MRQVLICWGGWDGHQPEQCAAVVSDMLKAEGFSVRVEPGTAAFADPAIRDYSLIVPMLTMTKIEKPEIENLELAIRSGVGLGGFHGQAGDSFRDCVQYQYMIGGQWVAHPGNIYDYTVNIVKPEDHS